MIRCRIPYCRETNNLMKNCEWTTVDGFKHANYVCKKHNAERRRKWYNEHPGARDKQYMNNLRSLAAKFGYRLEKI